MTPERYARLRELSVGGTAFTPAARDCLAEALDEIERLRALLGRTLPPIGPLLYTRDTATAAASPDGTAARWCKACDADSCGPLVHKPDCLYVAVWRACKTDPLPHGDTVEGEPCP